MVGQTATLMALVDALGNVNCFVRLPGQCYVSGVSSFDHWLALEVLIGEHANERSVF
ncbi:hypothetical protein GCM10007857_67260 [Bradyrhizobium iriomotense]|uniref:Uncharacterized protein n=1 Tax=Bradyrhizobium iriomotense TaxID=441950 RepID=A0ABQ6B6I0_9BRAD|nr:hypothetical protein GCM10007857_67260 [Bradyrhizobium iriomotense]